jgi:hypothetical protein
VVDASGSDSRASRWLEDLGYPRIPEDIIRVDVGYASRVYRRHEHPSHDWTVLVIYPKPPGTRRAGVLYPLDEERCLVTLVGWVGDHPPGDGAGFLDFARSLPQSDLRTWLDRAEPVSPIRRHVFPASRWRRFERLSGWPDRFVVVGDAVCRFNPVYGQGMTVSALAAVALGQALRGGIRAPGSTRRLQAALADHRTTPWLLAAASDFRFPEVVGHRPFGLSLLNWYTRGVLELAGENAQAHKGDPLSGVPDCAFPSSRGFSRCSGGLSRHGPRRRHNAEVETDGCTLIGRISRRFQRGACTWWRVTAAESCRATSYTRTASW